MSGYFDKEEKRKAGVFSSIVSDKEQKTTSSAIVNSTEVTESTVIIKPEKKKINFNASKYDPINKIELRNVCQVYEDKKGKKNVVFDSLDLEIKDISGRGQFTVLVGASGCGKSTLLRYIAGLQRPTSGEIFLDGKLQTDKDRVGMVFQQYSSLPWATVLQNVALPLELKGVLRKEREEQAMEMIKIVNLEGHEHKFAQYPILSGGQLKEWLLQEV